MENKIERQILEQFRKKREVLFDQKIKAMEELKRIERELEKNEDKQLEWKSSSGYFRKIVS